MTDRELEERFRRMEKRLAWVDQFREATSRDMYLVLGRTESLESWMDWVVDRLLGESRMRFKVQSVFDGALVHTFLSSLSDPDATKEYEDREKVRLRWRWKKEEEDES